MMSTWHSLKSGMSRLLHDRGGNFAMMTAILLPVTIGAAGVAVDVSNAALSQRQLQEASDSAALATAAALADGTVTEATAQAFAKDFMSGQMANYIGDTTGLKNATTASIVKTTSGKTQSYKVSVSSSYSVKLSGLAQAVGFKTVNVGASSSTQSGNTETQGAVSMYLVLDRSGSMGDPTTTVNATTPTYDCGTRNNPKTCTKYYTKIEALKLAVASLTTQLATADPDNQYVRTGAVSYNLDAQRALALNWGESAVSGYVNALDATGGTDSSDAIEDAYDGLTAASENNAHKNKNGQVPTKYIVFMTDGDNNYSSADTATKKTCDDARKGGIQVYTIAFMAPDRGKALLNYCATTPSNYFAAENMTGLLAAFKTIGAKASNQVTRLTN